MIVIVSLSLFWGEGVEGVLTVVVVVVDRLIGCCRGRL